MRLRTILFSLALAGSTLAQGERAQATPFVMPAGETPLATLIDTCADYLEWNVLYDAKAPSRVLGGGWIRRAIQPEVVQ